MLVRTVIFYVGKTFKIKCWSLGSKIKSTQQDYNYYPIANFIDGIPRKWDDKREADSRVMRYCENSRLSLIPGQCQFHMWLDIWQLGKLHLKLNKDGLCTKGWTLAFGFICFQHLFLQFQCFYYHQGRYEYEYHIYFQNILAYEKQ